MNSYRENMLTSLNLALALHENLTGSEKCRAQAAVEAINRIRDILHRKADELGYVSACVRSIPACRGECCKWHFPQNLDCTDFFVMLSAIPQEEHASLEKRLSKESRMHQCPFLDPHGCIFSFSARPLVCSNAWPCFMGDEYHAFLEAQRRNISAQYAVLKELRTLHKI
ncbi:MAG: hypothetical protein R2941_02575 [Desulfobacterales bacterium]